MSTPTMNYLERLCSYSYTAGVWWILYEGGGIYRYSELIPVVGCSSATLSRALRLLLGDGLVKRVGWKYQVVRPPWMGDGTREFSRDIPSRVRPTPG